VVRAVAGFIIKDLGQPAPRAEALVEEAPTSWTSPAQRAGPGCHQAGCRRALTRCGGRNCG